MDRLCLDCASADLEMQLKQLNHYDGVFGNYWNTLLGQSTSHNHIFYICRSALVISNLHLFNEDCYMLTITLRTIQQPTNQISSFRQPFIMYTIFGQKCQHFDWNLITVQFPIGLPSHRRLTKHCINKNKFCYFIRKNIVRFILNVQNNHQREISSNVFMYSQRFLKEVWHT